MVREDAVADQSGDHDNAHQISIVLVVEAADVVAVDPVEIGGKGELAGTARDAMPPVGQKKYVELIPCHSDRESRKDSSDKPEYNFQYTKNSNYHGGHEYWSR